MSTMSTPRAILVQWLREHYDAKTQTLKKGATEDEFAIVYVTHSYLTSRGESGTRFVTDGEFLKADAPDIAQAIWNRL